MRTATAATEIRLYVIFILIAIFSFTTGNSQTVKRTPEGNFIAVKDTTARSSAGRLTGKTFTDTKGNTYPVYISARNKYFIRRVSKAGNTYNQYLKVN